MSLFRTILLAADFSEYSREAFRVACSLGPGDETRLVVLNVAGPSSASGGPAAPGAGAGHDDVQERLRSAYIPDRPRPVEYRVRDGEPGEAILDVAGETGCDLIALGTHGRSGLGRLLAGSVAETVLRGAHCPVLATCPTGHAGLEPGGRTAVRAILHPTDFSECSSVALPVARALARQHGARLILLHAIWEVDVPHLREPAPIEDPDACRESLRTLRGAIMGSDPGHPVETQLRFGNSVDEILRAAEESECDLIVLGTHGRSGLGRMLLGSVAEEVLRRSPCPVLLVKPPPPALAPMGSAAGSASMGGG